MQEFMKKLDTFMHPNPDAEELIKLCNFDTADHFKALGHPLMRNIQNLHDKAGKSVYRLQESLMGVEMTTDKLYSHLLDVLIEDPPSSQIYKGNQAKKGSVRRALYLQKIASHIYQRSLFKGDFEERLAIELGFGDMS